MASEAVPEASSAPASTPAQQPAGAWGAFHWAENATLTLVLGLIVLIPLAEAALRKLLNIGISGAPAITQHLVLVASMLGGAVAARENRLLSLSPVTTFLKGGWKSAAQVIGSSFAIAIDLFLCVASIKFVISSYDSGRILAYGLPIWIVQLVLPIGFAGIGIRLAWHSAERWRERLLTLVLAGILVALAMQPPISTDRLVWPAMGLLLLATLLGAPIFTTLGGAALILFWGREEPIASVSISHYELVVNASLPTIPLFTLAGYFLAEGGASKRLVRVFQALVGSLRGGAAIVTALACAFFTTFTGASGVTILALGGLLMPVLLAARYSERNALGLLTGAGSLGLLFPPCLPLILYAFISSTSGANITLKQIFLGGMVPGLILVFLTILWGIYSAPKAAAGPASRFNGSEAWAAVWDAKWELLLPVVALVTLFGGFATAVEAAAVTALYAWVIETFFYRDLRPIKDTPRVVTECGLLVGGVMLILGVAMGFTNLLVQAQIPDQGVEWVQRSIHSQWVFLLALNGFLLIVGCLMDIYSAIIVVVPLIVPVGLKFGIDPVHLGIIFLANLELGFLTPPVGMNLFLSSYRFGKPMAEVTRSILPMLAVLAAGVLMITYWPWLTTWLPAKFGH